MPFDPSKYLAEKTANGPNGTFDPTAYLKDKTGEAPASDIGLLESGVRGAAQGASFGFAPAITGALEATPQALGALAGNNSLADILATYRKGRDESKANYDAAASANPKMSLAGGLVGGLAPALLSGGVSGAATLGSALKTGAGIGGLSGLGNAVSSGADLETGAKDVIEGAGTGAALGGLLHGAGSLLSGAPAALESTANERALKATGMMKPQLKNLKMQDLKANAYKASQAAPGVEPEVQDTVQKMGDLLLKKNPYQDTPVVTAGSTPEVILERTSDLADKSGKDIASILSSMDSQYNAGNPGIVANFPSPTAMSSEIENQLLKPIMVNGKIPPLAEPAANTVQKIMDTVNGYGNNPIPFEKAQELKQLIQNLTNYEAEGSANNQLLRRAGGIINKNIEDSADSVVTAAGTPEVFDQFKMAKDLYRTAKTSEQAALGKSASNMVNRDFGITDYMSAAAGAAAHGTPAGLAAMAGNKLARTYGNPTIATTAKLAAKGSQALSDGIGEVTRTITAMPKDAISSFGKQLALTSDPLAQRLGNVLAGASQRDDIGRNALIFSLMQQPAYREFLTNHFGNKEGVK